MIAELAAASVRYRKQVIAGWVGLRGVLRAPPLASLRAA